MIKASKSRIISLILVAALIVGIVPMSAFGMQMTSTPTKVSIAKGTVGVAAGDLSIEETGTTEWGVSDRDIVIAVKDSVGATTVKWASVPTVTKAVATNLVVEHVSISENENTCTVTVAGDDAAIDKLTISNVKYSVASTATLGHVVVNITSSNVSSVTTSNATIVAGVAVTTNPAVSTAQVESGQTNQVADQVKITESDTGTIAIGKKITLTIATAGVAFSNDPTFTATDTDYAMSGPISSSDNKSKTWTVTTASTASGNVITFGNIKYNIASGTATGDVNVSISTDPSGLVINPTSVKNAKVVIPGTTAAAASVPVIKKNTNNQAAGNVTITENSAGNATATVSIEVTATGVTFSSTPEATSTGGLILSSTTPANPLANKYTWTISTASTSTAGSIVISGFKYNVSATPAEGPIPVIITGSGITDASVVNAYVEATKIATVSAPVQTVIPASAEAAPAGDIVISEVQKGNLAIGKVIKLEIQKNTLGNTEAFLAEVPTISVTAGNIIVGPGTLDPARTFVTYTVSTASTVASTIKVTGIKYNTLGNAQGSVFVNVTYDGLPLGQVSNAFVGTLTPTFGDVPATHYAFNAVQFLSDAGIVSGRTSGDFDPNASITRGEFAKIICLAARLTPGTGGSASFSDTSGHWAAGYIEAAKTAGLISGYPDGTFRPNNLITRAEIAKLVVLGAGFATDTSGAGFSDIATNWAKDFILTAANNGVVNGYSDGTFRPNNHATRAEASVMVYNWLANK